MSALDRFLDGLSSWRMVRMFGAVAGVLFVVVVVVQVGRWVA